MNNFLKDISDSFPYGDFWDMLRTDEPHLKFLLAISLCLRNVSLA